MNIPGGDRMTKVRVHEYAKRVGKTSKDIVEELEKQNIEVTNHMSMIDDGTIAKLDKVFKPKNTS